MGSKDKGGRETRKPKKGAAPKPVAPRPTPSAGGGSTATGGS